MKIATVPRGTAVLCFATVALAGCGGGGSSKSSSAAGSSAATITNGVTTTESSSSAAPATSSAAAPATTTRVTTSAPAAPSGKPFTVTIPAGYKSDPSKASGVVVAYYAGPIVGNFSVNVNVTQEPAGGLTVQAAQRSAVAGLKKAITISKLSSVSALKLDGESALSYSFEDTQSGLHLKQGQVVVLHNDFAYVITFTAPVAQFSAQSPKASKLIKSLKFR